MAVLPIIKLGHPSLRKIAEPITEFDEDLVALEANLIDSMRASDGIGLAGPQVNILKRLFVIDLEIIDESQAAQAYVNPEIVTFSEASHPYEEGCLSIPNLAADVVRPSILNVRYQMTDGTEVTEEIDGMVARVFQHELDHLNGVLFIDHLPLIVRKKLEPELNKIREENSIS